MQADVGLQDKAETYLKALIVDAQPALTTDFDGATAFGELGIDSFRVLKVVKRLENDFGTLPKALAFRTFQRRVIGRMAGESACAHLGSLVQHRGNTFCSHRGAANDVRCRSYRRAASVVVSDAALDNLAVSEEVRHSSDRERSTNSSGMW
jgi:hypothetical protein